MATSISSITGSGLIAGFDTAGAVDGLLGLKQFEISQLEKKQAAQTAKQTALQEINDALSSFRNTAIGLSDQSTFFGYSASLTSNNASVPASSLLDISGTNAVNAGQHTIVVEKLAQAERIASSAAVLDSTATAVSSETASLNLTGSFQVEGVTINVAAADSLQDIAATINQANTGASATGVSASVIKSATNDFRLVLSSDATGATGFTISGADLDAAGALAGLQLGATGQGNAFQTLQIAQDAVLNVDGLSVSRSSNQISDLLSGVTIDLKQADPAVTVSMSIGVDEQILRDNVQAFVDAYNTVQDLVNSQFKFDSGTGSNGILATESLLTSLQTQLSSSLLKSVPGLASDRNSLVAIGVEPDSTGQLYINEDRFGALVTTDTAAIRDVFVAQGSSTNNDLQFLLHGLTTSSGTYSVDITQAAARASVTGTTDLSAGLAANETVTITDGSGSQAVVNLTAGQMQADILSALNTEFGATYTEVHNLSTALTAGGSPATGGTTLSALGLGVAAGDTITIAGTSRTGAAVSSSFSVLDPATDTVSSLLSAIQSAFDQNVIASLDSSGRVQITDNQSGASQLSLSLTANNEGGGTLAFGTDNVVTEGRYALAVESVVSGNGIEIRSSSFGSGYTFSIAQSVDGLGIADQSASGADVAGTIAGLAATGKGQMLLGSSGNVDGMAVFYTGTTTATSDLVVGIGAGALFDGMLDTYSNPVSGLVQGRILDSANTYDDLATRIVDLTAQMERQRILLTNSFTQMESAMATLQQSSSFLSQQIAAQNASSN